MPTGKGHTKTAEQDVLVSSFQDSAPDNGGGGEHLTVSFSSKSLVQPSLQLLGYYTVTFVWLSKEGGLAGAPKAAIGAWGAGRLWRNGATGSYCSGMQRAAAVK